MAQNRSRRLRKKLRVDEFQEFGFDINWTFDESVSEQDIDALVDQFIDEVIEPRQLGFHGGGHKEWEGIIATQAIGKCTEDDIAAVQAFWQSKPVSGIEVSALYDIWWG
ncbi:50S ribosome-binding protein YggL [Shewanella phaeophyticola]|uniref:50S ribosome-binding protein YggL n=1 Tax=Shewanella phaeophyticola TaxID=2978345 RepID=A0ABT2NZ82_9GAMM|nr:50S ribosome-binding protein YggL [Shewanella sp. KJ10-1]MCT8985696.1 50S ribosome-binding protein YggL [Shewanella sp. KJ10-1]